MGRRSRIFWSIFVLPSLLYLIWVSLYLSPGFQGIGIENDFKEYYLAYASGKRDVEQFYQRKIYQLIDFIDLRVRRSSDAPLAKYIWIYLDRDVLWKRKYLPYFRLYSLLLPY